MADLLARVFLMRESRIIVKQRAKPTDAPISDVPMIVPVLRELDPLPDPPELQALGPHTEAVFNAICSGWSNGMIVAHLREKYDTTPPLDLIQQYRELVPIDMILPPTSIDDHFRGLRVMVEPLSEMQRILRIDQERLSAQLEVESLAKEGFNPKVDARLRTYWKRLKEFAELTQQQTGAILSEVEVGAVMTIRELYDMKVTKTQVRREVQINADEAERQGLQADEGLLRSSLLEGGTGK